MHLPEAVQVLRLQLRHPGLRVHAQGLLRVLRLLQHLLQLHLQQDQSEDVLRMSHEGEGEGKLPNAGVEEVQVDIKDGI